MHPAIRGSVSHLADPVIAALCIDDENGEAKVGTRNKGFPWESGANMNGNYLGHCQETTSRKLKSWCHSRVSQKDESNEGHLESEGFETCTRVGGASLCTAQTSPTSPLPQGPGK